MKIPYHIAIIMDGNGRWAKDKNLPRTIGHKEGERRAKEIVREAKQIGVKIITFFAFSTENWARPSGEVKFIFSYLNNMLSNYGKELMKEDIKFNVIGRRDRIDKKIIQKIQNLEEITKKNKSFTINLALDYGGRWDIISAVLKIIAEYEKDKVNIEDINADYFGTHLSLSNIPDPDLLIRTSGEQRISNFLLWNLAYAELYFTNICWPDFNADELKKAIGVYSERERRFGKLLLYARYKM